MTKDTQLPELPEIEHLRRSLEPRLVGARVLGTRLFRRDYARPPLGPEGRTIGRAGPRHLLRDTTISELRRHGKQLAVLSDQKKTLCLHLGMSGQLRYLPRGARLDNAQHVHCVWTLQGPAGEGRLVFRDPRRFGGIWCFDSFDDLADRRWSRLGPDALHVSSRTLGKRLSRTTRAIKSALLDQSVLAGVGNIYADESLFEAGIHPSAPARDLRDEPIRRLGRCLRRILARACEQGGSTIRSYIDSNGRSGSYANRHLVYGRKGEPCVRCGTRLEGMIIAQRSTVFCPACQK